MRLVVALMLALGGCGTAAAAPAFHLDLPAVQFTRMAGSTQVVTGTIRNDGTDSLFVQGVLTDVPASMGGDSAAAGFLAAAPAALGPGEAWTGEIVSIHVAANEPVGAHVFSVSILAAGSEYDPSSAVGTNLELDVVASTGVTGSGPILVERLSTSPNPFRGGTGVRLDLSAARSVDVCIFDVSGRLIRRLFRGWADAGSHLYAWDGADMTGRHVGEGVFMVQAQAGSTRFRSKVVVLH